MKKVAYTILFFIIAFANYGQDLINPYTLPLNILKTDFQYPPTNGFIPTNGFLFTPYARPQMSSGGYTGEYMIMLNEHPWYKNPVFRDLAKTFTIEVVSFPFTIPCWDQPTNCAVPLYGSLNERFLMMPDDTYNPLTSKWNHLNRKFEGVFQNTGNWISEPGLLISKQFISGPTQAISSFNGGFYPHTILKHTIYLHCTNVIISPIIDSLTFYYDNTRGQLRWYPFQINNNIANGTPSAFWDVVYRPEVLVDRITVTLGYNYSHTSNTDWFDGGTIDYFPFNQSNTTCGNYNPTLSSSFAKYFLQNPYNTLEERPSLFDFIFNPPYSLTSTFLRDNSGRYPAGYALNGNYLTARPGVKHTYKIDQNINLLILNYSEKTIYNPSEVTITASADNLIFPEQYTFKTIRGVYPTVAEVAADNISENGGPYTDLRDVPVTTDLVSENPDDAINFPLSVTPAKKHLYAARYYLEAGSKLTISNCVRLLDATFDVKQGSSMFFTDYTTTVGVEDHSFNQAQKRRFKVQTLSGAVLRNNAPIQYLQNGIITQPIPLHYTATDEILAGYKVETDAEVLQNDYSIEPTGDVTLEAANTVHLEEGFRAKEGCSFRAFTAPQNIVNTCLPFNNSTPAARAMATKTQAPHIALQVSPNPTKGIVYISFAGNTLTAEKIQVRDALGKIIFEKLAFNSTTDLINISDSPNGIYALSVFNFNTVATVKVVLNK